MYGGTKEKNSWAGWLCICTQYPYAAVRIEWGKWVYLPSPPLPLSMHHCTPLPNMHSHTERDSYCTTIAITYVAGTAGNRIYVRLVQNRTFSFAKL